MPDSGSLARRVARSTALRVAISVGLLVAVLASVDLAAMAHRLEDGRWGLFALAVALVVAALALAGARWHRFLAAAGVPTSRAVAVRAYFAGAFATSFLPATVGGDVVRGWIGAPAGHRAAAYGTVIVDRMSMLACGLAVAWVAVVAGVGTPRGVLAALVLSTVAFLVPAALLVAAAAVPSRSVRRLVPRRLVAAARELRAGLRGSTGSPAVIAATTTAGIAYQLVVVTATWLLARTFDVDLGLAEIAVVLPPVLLLSALPVSIGGLGVREVSFVALLAPFDVSASDATLVALAAGATYALASSPGAFWLARGGSARHDRLAAGPRGVS